MQLPRSRKVWGWAFYYWGNHAFGTSVVTLFFPIFFKSYWSVGADVTVSTFRLGIANSVASLVVALSAPVLGAIADRGNRRKRFLMFSAYMGALMVQFVGVPAAIVFGQLGERIGAKRAIFIGLAVYVFITVFATFMRHSWQFFVLAGMVGLVQGGVQLLSRSYYARLVPVERAGEFFGFYNMLGEFAAIIGPFLIGFVSYATGSPRLSILSVILLLAAGAILLARVDTRELASPISAAAYSADCASAGRSGSAGHVVPDEHWPVLEVFFSSPAPREHRFRNLRHICADVHAATGLPVA